jgi:hypothetical protein
MNRRIQCLRQTRALTEWMCNVHVITVLKLSCSITYSTVFVKSMNGKWSASGVSYTPLQSTLRKKIRGRPFHSSIPHSVQSSFAGYDFVICYSAL